MKAVIQTPFTTPIISYTSCSLISKQRHYSYLSSPAQQTQQKHFRIFSNSQQQQEDTPKRKKGGKPALTIGGAGWVHLYDYVKETIDMSEEDALTSANLLKRTRHSTSGSETDLIFREDADNVVNFLQHYCGFNNSIIKLIVCKYPNVLIANASTTLRPKVKLLKDAGFSTSDLAQLLSSKPKLFLSINLKPVVDYLREFLGNDDDRDVVSVVKELRHNSKNGDLVKNLTMLETECGVPREVVKEFLIKYPSKFTVKNAKLRDLISWAEENWGIRKGSAEVMVVICQYHGKKMNSKFQPFLQFGWRMCDVFLLFANDSGLFEYGDIRLKTTLSFYMNKLRYDPGYLASRVELFTVSLEIVRVRYKVLLNLKKIGLIEHDYDLASAFVLTEEEFFNKFVSPYVNASDVCQEYVDNRGSSEAVLLMETSEDGSDQSNGAAE